jgi:putative sigma-54 modulation protein
MEIDISARHFHVTEPLKEYITEKILKLDKYQLKLESVHVILDVQKFYHIAEITALGKHMRFTAKEQSTDMYAAFDKSFGNLQLQFRRKHDRVKDHKKKTGKTVKR